MTKQNESAEVVKDRIIKVATDLFSEYGINAVSIRKIAEEAGINHALIIRYFGSKDNLVTEILHREISSLTAPYPMKFDPSPYAALANLHKTLLNTLATDQNAMRLIVRTGLDGLSPEQYVSATQERAANLIAKWIKSQQTDPSLPDAKLVSILLTGALFSLVSINQWLMTSVGLPPDNFEKRKSDLIDTAVWIIARAIGLPQETAPENEANPQESAHNQCMPPEREH